MTAALPQPKVMPIYKGVRHRWTLTNGQTFEAVLLEVYDFSYTALFEVQLDDDRTRWINVTGLISYETTEP